MKTWRRPATTCPWCGTVQDAVSQGTRTGGRRPRAGDVAMCFDCGEWVVLAGRALRMRKPTGEEFEEIGLDEDCRRLREAWVALREEQRRPS